MSFSNPEIEIGDDDPELVEPLLAYTMYSVIEDPPLFTGVVNDTEALASPTDATTLVGAFGTVEGVTGEDSDDWIDVPIPLVAVTLNV